jgi:hypothetical protein
MIQAKSLLEGNDLNEASSLTLCLNSSVWYTNDDCLKQVWLMTGMPAIAGELPTDKSRGWKTAAWKRIIQHRHPEQTVTRTAARITMCERVDGIKKYHVEFVGETPADDTVYTAEEIAAFQNGDAALEEFLAD